MIKKIVIMLSMLVLGAIANGDVLFEQNFDSPDGTAVGGDQWAVTNGSAVRSSVATTDGRALFSVTGDLSDGYVLSFDWRQESTAFANPYMTLVKDTGAGLVRTYISAQNTYLRLTNEDASAAYESGGLGITTGQWYHCEFSFSTNIGSYGGWDITVTNRDTDVEVLNVPGVEANAAQTTDLAYIELIAALADQVSYDNVKLVIPDPPVPAKVVLFDEDYDSPDGTAVGGSVWAVTNGAAVRTGADDADMRALYSVSGDLSGGYVLSFDWRQESTAFANPYMTLVKGASLVRTYISAQNTYLRLTHEDASAAYESGGLGITTGQWYHCEFSFSTNTGSYGGWDITVTNRDTDVEVLNVPGVEANAAQTTDMAYIELIAALADQVSYDNVKLEAIVPVTAFPAIAGPASATGDLNRDGVVNQDDVDLANSYLDGSIDGGDDAATRQTVLVNLGYTDEQILTALNLNEFDVNGDGTFDAADVAAVDSLMPRIEVTLFEQDFDSPDGTAVGWFGDKWVVSNGVAVRTGDDAGDLRAIFSAPGNITNGYVLSFDWRQESTVFANPYLTMVKSVGAGDKRTYISVQHTYLRITDEDAASKPYESGGLSIVASQWYHFEFSFSPDVGSYGGWDIVVTDRDTQTEVLNVADVEALVEQTPQNHYIELIAARADQVSYDNIKLVALIPGTSFPEIPDAAGPELLVNGGFNQVANPTPDDGGPNWNIAGSLSDWEPWWGRSAELTGWSSYYADPNNLASEIGTTNNPSLVADPVGFTLDGTDYLNADFNASTGILNLNSAGDFRNGIMQTLSGVTINPASTYTLTVNAMKNSGVDNSAATFSVALTTGSGTDATNLTNAVTSGLLQMPVDNLTGSLAPQTLQVSGADLAAGQVNILIENRNNNTIPNFPDVASSNKMYVYTSQVKIGGVSLIEGFVAAPGDFNQDGFVNQADVDLLNSYLDGSIDDGDDAATRQAELAALGYTDAQILAALGLTDLDIDGDGTFDADDVTALEALFPPVIIVIEGAAFDGSGNFDVDISGLTSGTVYKLWRETDLTADPSFTNMVDSAEAGSGADTLSDPNPPAEGAFYKVTD